MSDVAAAPVADADADPSVAVQSRAELEANLAEYQGQLDQVSTDVLEFLGVERSRKRERKPSALLLQ